MPSLSSDLKAFISTFQSRPSEAGEENLRRLRLALAQSWAGADAQQAARMSQTEAIEATRILRASGLRSLGLTADEETVCAPWLAVLRERWPSPDLGAVLLACSLFYPAHELGIRPLIEDTPLWLLVDYLDYLFEAPELLLRPGESQRYARHMEEALRRFHEAAEALGPEIEERVVSRINVIQAYFNDDNLRDLMRARARVIERYLSRHGCPLDHEVPVRDRSRRRVGFLAPGYGSQTEGSFALANIAGLDRKELEVVLYALHTTASPIEASCRAHADRFTVLPADLPSQVARIRADELDVLVVLTNIGAVCSQLVVLSAHRLARVQVASMASPLTTGFARMDAFLSSEQNDGEDAGAHYTEDLLRIPGALNHYAFADEPASGPAPTREELGIPAGTLTLFSALNYYKIVPELAARWAQIMAALPDSLLVLLPFNPNWSSHYPEHAFRKRLQRDLAAHAVDPSRLRILNPVPTRGDVVALMRLADLYLDGYPFAGACSIYDPLLAGVPPVAREGHSARSRHGGIMLRMFGLDELVARDDHAYVDLVSTLGRDGERRAALRDRVRSAMARSNPVLDTADFGRRLTPVLRRLAEPVAPRGLSAELDKRAQRLAQSRLRTFTDTNLASSIILPCFQPATTATPLHMVDVGACYGEISKPFLTSGWTADLFEPDPGCRNVLAPGLAAFATRARLHACAVSEHSSQDTRFFRATTHGLSGLGPSPYAKTAEVILVPTVRLGEYLHSVGTERIDFLKIDTEGQDFKVLASHDFERLAPRFALIEVNSAFSDQGFEQIRDGLAAMQTHGYAALVLRYEDDGTFSQGIWDRYWLKEARVLRELRPADMPIMANILFYREDDAIFARRFLQALDQALASAA